MKKVVNEKEFSTQRGLKKINRNTIIELEKDDDIELVVNDQLDDFFGIDAGVRLAHCTLKPSVCESVVDKSVIRVTFDWTLPYEGSRMESLEFICGSLDIAKFVYELSNSYISSLNRHDELGDSPKAM